MAQQPQMARTWRTRNVVALGIVSFFTDIHSETILALLPQFMANSLGLSKESIGLIEGLADATASGLKILSGWWSDRIGRRKPVVLAGYALSTVMKPILAVAQVAWHVLAVRIGDRIGKGVRTSARDALVAESVVPEQRGRAFGFHRGMDTAGAVVGTALAMVLLHALGGDYRRVFLLATIPGAAAVLVLALGVQERRRTPVVNHNGKPKRELPGSFGRFLLAHSVYSAGNFSYAFFLLRAQDVGWRAQLVPALYLLHNVVYAVAAFPAGAVLDRIGVRPAQVGTYLLHFFTCLGFGLLGTPMLMPLWFAIYGVHMAATGACSRTTAAGLMRPDHRGLGMGAFHACEGAGLLVASGVSGWLWERTGSGATPFYYGAGLALAAAVLALWALRPTGGTAGGQAAPTAGGEAGPMAG